MSQLVCIVFGSCVLALACALTVDQAWIPIAVQLGGCFWMLHGASRLKEGGWRPSFGRDGAIWIIKDSLAMLIWPILYNWIARRAEKE
jgi:hypothetical protein